MTHQWTSATLPPNGGPLSLLLGVYAMSTCPDIVTREGSRKFEIYHALSSITFSAANEPPDQPPPCTV